MPASVITDEHEQKQENPFEVEGRQPGFVYRGLNVNSRNIGRKLSQGWEIVKAGDPEKFVANESTPMKKGADVDGAQHISDVVLARLPEEKHKERVDKNRRAINRLNAMIVRDYDKDVGELGFNPKRDPTGAATKYAGGTTETGWDREKMNDDEFKNKYGMSKNEVEE